VAGILARVLTLAAIAFAAHAQPHMDAAPLVAPFSASKLGPAPQAPWVPFIIGAQKTPTDYDIVEDDGKRVLHAKAVAAASAITAPVKFDITAAPIMEWRWKVSGLIIDADNAVASKEDSPARVILAFDGDKSKLSAFDRSKGILAKSVTGRDSPYAELMYIWSSKAPVGTVIANPHTKRVQMVVASTGSAGVGKWQTLSRNVREDFIRAFGEEPGMLTDVGVLTDTDNTSATVEAWYGDIRFVPAKP
jgi:hypothetical protein